MNLSDATIRGLWAAFILLAAVVLLQNAVIFFSLNSEAPTGRAQGEVRLCLTGQVPTWPNGLECDTAIVGTNYSCDLRPYSLTNESYTYALSVQSGNPNGTSLFSSVGSDGNLSFTAQNNQTGNYTVQVTAYTISACPTQGNTTFNLTVVESFDPPILLRPIPNSTWSQDSTIVPYNMRNYWFDPAGAVEFLTYTVTGNQNIDITFEQTGEVTLVPDDGFCGKEVVRYTATSPWTNLSTQSNLVTLDVECTPTGDDDTSSSSGGGGGGGGGGVVRPRACVEDVFCYEWSTCQYTSAVTETGDSLELIIEGVRGSRTYLVEDMPEDTDVFYEGYRYRECFDTTHCSDRTMFYTSVCEYQPSCFDGIQNQDETGIDCGGVCPQCLDEQTIQVPEEEAVITPPVEEQEPALLETESRLTLFLFYAVLGLILLVTLLLTLRSLIKSIISKLVFKHKKKNRVILLSVDAKTRILEALDDIESRVGKEPVLKLQEELSAVVREYFKAVLGLEFEFTYEELVTQLQEQHIMDLLQDVLQAFFNRSSELEFSGKAVTENVLQALINEVREIVYQTAVLSQQDYKELDKDLSFRDIPDSVPQTDRFYLLLSQAQIALQYGRLGAAKHLYELLQGAYTNSSEQLQALWYQDLQRFYLELALAIKKEGSPLLRRGKK